MGVDLRVVVGEEAWMNWVVLMSTSFRLRLVSAGADSWVNNSQQTLTHQYNHRSCHSPQSSKDGALEEKRGWRERVVLMKEERKVPSAIPVVFSLQSVRVNISIAAGDEEIQVYHSDR